MFTASHPINTHLTRQWKTKALLTLATKVSFSFSTIIASTHDGDHGNAVRICVGELWHKFFSYQECNFISGIMVDIVLG